MGCSHVESILREYEAKMTIFLTILLLKLRGLIYGKQRQITDQATEKDESI